MLVSAVIFGLLGSILFLILRQGTGAWLKVDTKNDAQSSLRKVETVLLEDLKRTSKVQVATPIRVGAGDGYALWFLTAMYRPDPTLPLQRFDRDPVGTPLWRANVLYYLVRPGNHAALAGYSCLNEGGDNGAAHPDATLSFPPAGDRFCPHKFMIRKVILGDTLLSSVQIAAYLTVPTGFNLSSMSGEANLDPDSPPQVLAKNLLTFAPVNDVSGFVQFELGAFRARDAEKTIKVGTLPLDTSPFGMLHRARVYPENP